MLRKQITSIKRILKSSEPMDCFKMQLKTLKLFGVFLDSSTTVYRKSLSIFPSFLVLKLCVVSTLYILADDVAFEDKLQGSFTAITSFLCVVKLYYTLKHQEKLLNLLKTLKSRVDYVTEEETKTLNREAVFPTFVCYLMLQASSVISCLTYGLFPIGSSNYNKSFPVYGCTGNAYKLAYTMQLMSIISASTLWVCVDTINFGLLAHHNAMLKILGLRLSHLGWPREPKKRTANDAHNYNRLCECVEYHLQISRYQSETTEIYSSILFAKITLSVMIICSFVYTLGLKVSNYGSFTAHMGILSVIVSTLFMISWTSEQICATSDNLLNKAVECNFQHMDRKTITALLIVMQGLNNTVLIEVGSTFKIIVNLKMFVKIMDFAYKCLALLKTAAA
ncbi:odorant receptor Or1-like isoform X2 [Bradysia coprophila]|uniref:odorant receptor Or1-like isoform X2 n=1 Tax=Bradysia coprophila TaxID=38358 RepID=UPI00187DC3CF|nr:odorant receptor Or1-like isoform X2 [Bradysia coprophila]